MLHSFGGGVAGLYNRTPNFQTVDSADNGLGNLTVDHALRFRFHACEKFHKAAKNAFNPNRRKYSRLAFPSRRRALDAPHDKYAGPMPGVLRASAGQ
jgi:hypothetical protein